jgi:simple sugar transport system permease protein
MIESLLAAVFSASTPLLLAATGELIAEKAGVLNLGVEGMMLVGAVAAFAAASASGEPLPGVAASIAAGMGMALVFAFLSLTMQANQTATGLALTIFGRGLSALVGAGFIGATAPTLPAISVPGLGLRIDPLGCFALLALLAASWFTARTRGGLILRAVGDSQDAAHAIGYRVIRVRYAAVLFGGAMAGLAGAYMSLYYSPLWAQDLTAGRGWVALALVVFSAWRPVWLLAGAWLFGLLMYLSLYVQGIGLPVPSPLISAAPYVGTIVVLALISRDRRRMRLNRPAMLGRAFRPAA